MNGWLILAVFVGAFVMDALIATYISAIAEQGIGIAILASITTYGLQWVGLGTIIATDNFGYLIPGVLGCAAGTAAGLLILRRWPIRSAGPEPCADCGLVQADPFLHRRWHLIQDGNLILSEDKEVIEQ